MELGASGTGTSPVALPEPGTLRSQFLKHYVFDFAESETAQEMRAAGRNAVFLELPKLELAWDGETVPALDEAAVLGSISFVRERYDCADFTLSALLRVLYRFDNSPLLSPALRTELEETALGFKYWIDEPGNDVMCYWTENHQILFATCELLAGQRFPDQAFSNNGKTGKWHAEHATTAIKKWLGWRLKYGFSEWLSNCYYDEDLLALANLVDYAEDADIRRDATRIVDLILFDIAVHSYRGTFGATGGRTYMRDVLPAISPVSPVTQLYWGQGTLDRVSLSAMLLVTSSYKVPEAIRAVAAGRPEVMEARARHSLNVDDAIARGVRPELGEDLMFFWGAQVRQHRKVIDASLQLTPPSHYLTPRLKAWRDYFEREERLGQPYDPDPDASADTQADVYTYRTPDYQLSCVQDYRPGKAGFQQHIWQATLGGDTPETKAVVFTTQPGTEELRGRPSYWTGNPVLPKAVAHKNVLLCFYWCMPTQTSLWYTHAYFPKDRFEETVETNGWLFGRAGEGYVALRSMRPSHWADLTASVLPALATGDRSSLGSMKGRDVDLGPSGPQGEYDRISLGHRNVWVCELGRAATHGSFGEFVKAVSSATLEGDEWGIRYESPSLGTVTAGWVEPLKVAGEEIQLHDYPRFDNPYAQAEFGGTRYEIRAGGLSHTVGERGS